MALTCWHQSWHSTINSAYMMPYDTKRNFTCSLNSWRPPVQHRNKLEIHGIFNFRCYVSFFISFLFLLCFYCFFSMLIWIQGGLMKLLIENDRNNNNNNIVILLLIVNETHKLFRWFFDFSGIGNCPVCLKVQFLLKKMKT